MVVDANVLLNAVNPATRNHDAAREWMDNALSGTAPVYIPWITLLAFIRISTSAAIFRVPMSVQAAMDHVDGLLAASPVVVPTADSQMSRQIREHFELTGTAGNLTNDAFLAALALQHGVPVVSYDNDFTRFPEVEWIKPG